MTEQRKPTIDCTPLSWLQIRAVEISKAYEPNLSWSIYNEKGEVFDDGLKTFNDVSNSILEHVERLAELKEEGYDYLDGQQWIARFSDPDLCDELGNECVFISRSIGFEIFPAYKGDDVHYNVTVDGQSLAKMEA